MTFRALTPAILALLLPALAPAHALAAADLVVDQLVLSPDSGPNGTSVQVTATVRNRGDADAAASKTRFRVNQDASSVASTDPVLCSGIPTPALAAGTSSDVLCTATLSGLPAGASYVWAIADVNNDAGQSDRSNDRRSAPFSIDNSPADLVISDFSVDPSSVTNGTQVTISITVTNQGSGTALASKTRVRINASPDAVTSTDAIVCSGIPTPSIAPGDSAVVECEPTISGRPPGATSYLWAIADVNKEAGQSDTTNDRASAPLEISGTVCDLVVDSVVVDPVGGANGDPVLITATIRNQGEAAALASTTRVRLNQNPDTVGGADTLLCGAIATHAIDPGETVSVTCRPTIDAAPPGISYVWVIADATGTAGQADRTNDRNKTQFTVDPAPTPDLSVHSISANPSAAANGRQVTITAKITNDSTASSEPCKTRFLINQSADLLADGDTVLCDQVDTPAISAGGTATVTCKIALAGRPVGTNFLWVVADATALTSETNRANDALSAAFTVVSPPSADLVVTGLVATPVAASSGQTVSLVVTIRNQGVLDALASNTRIRLGASADAPLDSDPILCAALPTAALVAGASTNVDCQWTLANETPGPAYVWATADVNNTAGQYSRSNDSTSTPFTVLPRSGPDLVVSRLVAIPNAARNGDSIVVKARVTNVGPQAAPASTTIFRINQRSDGTDPGDQILCAIVATPALAPTETAKIHCRRTLRDRPLGANSIWAVADASGTAGDVDASNNKRRVAFTITPPECSAEDTAPVLAWPVEQPRMIQDYASFGSVPLGAGKLGYHSGIDLVSQLAIPADQTPVYAAADGEIVALKKDCPSPADVVVNPPNGKCAGGWGNYVVIRHGAGIYTVYAHLGQVFAAKGCVEQGERIAIAGSSGSTTILPHLHFDVLAHLEEPVLRSGFGAEYYKKLHPFVGRQPETPDGEPEVHVDARDYMQRSRVRITQAVAASRGLVTGGGAAYLAKDQQFLSYGELVPGYVCIDLPSAIVPQNGPPYADDIRYGWVPASSVEVLETGVMPGSVRIDGYGLFVSAGVGPDFVVVRDQARLAASEVTKVWGDQQYVATGGTIAESGSGRLWQPIDIPGTSASGAGKPRQAFVPADSLGPAPTP